MAEQNPTASSNSLPASTTHDQGSFTLKLIELQEALVQSQEKNLMLSAQLRELERMSRDGEDLKSELINQSSFLLARVVRTNSCIKNLVASLVYLSKSCKKQRSFGLLLSSLDIN